MFIRRFIAKDMQEAIQKIRKDFGPDAVILDSKQVRSKGIGGMFKKKQVEVVAAFEPNKDKKIETQADFKELKTQETDTAAPAVAPPQEPDFPVSPQESTALVSPQDDEKIESLSKQLMALKSTVQDFANRIRIVDKDATLTFSPETLAVYNGLVDRDVSEDIAKAIAKRTQEASEKKEAETEWIAQQIVIDRLGEPAAIKPKQFARKVLMFAGPTGAGKTTTLVKLAGMLTFEQGLKVGLINMDTYRVGAIEHIKIYSEIMNIPLQTAYNPEELSEALEALEDRDVVLIDTAGKSARDKSYKKDLSAYMEAANVDDVMLVISIVTGSKTCSEIIKNYSFVGSYKLIITKLDEVSAWGNILNIKKYADKPISYITMGQEVPSDISLMDPQKLAENIVFGQEVTL